MSPLVFAILIVVGAFAAIAAVLERVQVSARAQAQAVQARFPNAQVVQANFFGQESAGVMQLRGNGALALTDTELYFERLWPRREYCIPLAAIEGIETPSSYLGKTNFQPLLKVVFRNESGQLDSMAWLVPDVKALKQTIEMARR
jgi:hypothetical protein